MFEKKYSLWMSKIYSILNQKSWSVVDSFGW